MILVFPFDYAEAVLDGHAGHGVDVLSSTRAADPTDINELRLCFLYPEWASGRWAGMQPRRSVGSQPMRLKNEKTIDSMFSDGSEYEENTPRVIRDNNGKVVGVVRYPMRRTSEKVKHTGRGYRLAKAEEQFNAWCAANASTGPLEPFDEFEAQL